MSAYSKIYIKLLVRKNHLLIYLRIRETSKESNSNIREACETHSKIWYYRALVRLAAMSTYEWISPLVSAGWKCHDYVEYSAVRYHSPMYIDNG